MYKRHVHSAIGRGRPIPNDIARVAEGIAASLRQFSISAQRCADDQASGTPSRSQRAARAVKEVSSLAPSSTPPSKPSKGIDARSLAARPPGQTFTITRVDSRSDFRLNSTPISRAPGAATSRSGASRGGGVSRGGAARGGSARGRGGLRGRNAKGPRQKKPKHAEESDFFVPPYDEVEAAAYDEITGGVPAPYEPITSLESLRGWGPAVITSPQGIQESVNRGLAIGMDKKYPGFHELQWHRQKVREAGYTMVRDATEREVLGNLNSKVRGASVVNEQRQALEKQWIAGHYEKPNAGVDRKDVLGLVGAYSRKSSGYLAEETRKFEEDVAKLLPESYKKTAAKVQKSTV